MQRLFFAFGSGFALIAVITGAFAAHALKTRLSPDMFTTFEVAARYQMYHALGLIAVAWAASQWSQSTSRRVRLVICGWHRYFFGSLYILSLTGIRWLGAITPIGGAAFIIGWGCLLWAIIRS